MKAGLKMNVGGKTLGWGGAVAAVALFALSPAVSAPGSSEKTKRISLSERSSSGTFTPAAADPRLAAMFARSSVRSAGFKFTPVKGRTPSRAVTVAVRARTTAPAPARVDRPVTIADATPSAFAVAPGAYKLGVSVGWKNFALTGGMAQADIGALQGGRRSSDVGVSYRQKRLTTRVQIETDRPIAGVTRGINKEESVAVDFGGSYRLSRKLDLTAGVRYKAERDPLERVTDTRRDSQAVYIGTQIRF
jgi:hypothetical protein